MPNPEGKNLLDHPLLTGLYSNIEAEVTSALIPLLAKAVRPEHVKYTGGDQFVESLLSAIEDDCAIMIVSNHRGHADGLPLGYIAHDLLSLTNAHRPGYLNGFRLIVAASMESGDQGLSIQKAYRPAKPILKKLGVEMIPVVREADMDKFDMKFAVSSFEPIVNARKDRMGVIVLPEATVQGGRMLDPGASNSDTFKFVPFVEFDAEARRTGMVPIQKKSLNTIHKRLGRTDGPGKNNVLILPVGMEGGEKIFDPDRKKITDRALKVGLGLSHEQLMTINVGMPIKTQDIADYFGHWPDDDTLNEFIMKNHIAPLLSEDARGVYR